MNTLFCNLHLCLGLVVKHFMLRICGPSSDSDHFASLSDSKTGMICSSSPISILSYLKRLNGCFQLVQNDSALQDIGQLN